MRVLSSPLLTLFKGKVHCVCVQHFCYLTLLQFYSFLSIVCVGSEEDAEELRALKENLPGGSLSSMS